MTKLKLMVAIALVAATLTACNDADKQSTNTEQAAAAPAIEEEAVTYSADTITAKGFVVLDKNAKGKRPAVLVVHEWWGIGDYVRQRAKQLAELGYVAMVVDMYGNGRTGDNPDAAGALATPFYMNPMLAKTRLEAAMQKLKTYEQVDTANIAAIGYCYGGFVVLNTAKLGSDLKGVVVFHGNLSGAPVNKDLLKADVLVCHGEADPLVPAQEVSAFRKSMDSISASYTFKAYPGALHAFTNPNATEVGKKFQLPVAYDAKADSSSWSDMKAFLGKVLR